MLLEQTTQHVTPARLVSLAVHGLGVSVLWYLADFTTNRPGPIHIPQRPTLYAPLPLQRDPLPAQTRGGDGGFHATTPPSRGQLPRPAELQILPPQVQLLEQPKLPVPPSLEVPDRLPVDLKQPLGDPLASPAPPSSGPGTRGIGNGGNSGGIGPGKGPGAGSGTSTDGAILQPGNGVTPPRLIHQVDPEYSEEARKAHFQGSVTISVVVDANGKPRDLRVVRGPGLGLEERALEAIAKWRFSPGMKGGKPVPVQALVEVHFHLL